MRDLTMFQGTVDLAGATIYRATGAYLEFIPAGGPYAGNRVEMEAGR